METKSIGFIGGGRVTKIFLQAFANHEKSLDSVVVFDTNPDVLAALKRQFPAIVIAENAEQAAAPQVVFIALHPPVIMETLDEIAGTVSEETLVISLAPKITIEKIASKLKSNNLARMIPNATSYICEGYNPVSFYSRFSSTGKDDLLELLRLLGTTLEVAESKLEAYAILSAMLPTYFWFQWKELADLGERMGLPGEEAQALIRQTLQAALNLYFDHGLSPEKVMDLIPVKPIGDHEEQIIEIYENKLMNLFSKIKP